MSRKTHFNKLDPADAELLALLAEECAEVIQAVGKILRHGFESTYPGAATTNRDNLMKELGHVDCAFRLLVKRQQISRPHVTDAQEKKMASIAQYLHHSQP